MASDTSGSAIGDAITTSSKPSVLSRLRSWGHSSLPPMLLATLITAAHTRPARLLPLAFVPPLLFSTYLNVSSFVVDSAGFTAALSALYVVLARRGPGGARGGLGGATRGLGMVLPWLLRRKLGTGAAAAVSAVAGSATAGGSKATTTAGRRSWMAGWGPRLVTRGAAKAVAGANVLGGGMVYALDRREKS